MSPLGGEKKGASSSIAIQARFGRMGGVEREVALTQLLQNSLYFLFFSLAIVGGGEKKLLSPVFYIILTSCSRGEEGGGGRTGGLMRLCVRDVAGERRRFWRPACCASSSLPAARALKDGEVRGGKKKRALDRRRWAASPRRLARGGRGRGPVWLS